MKTEAVAAFRPCGCLDEIYDPDHPNWHGADFLEAIGFKCEVMDGGAAEAIPYVECEHGEMQQQLASLVKMKAGEIERLRDWIAEDGKRTDTCTFNVLGTICDGCRCKRNPEIAKL